MLIGHSKKERASGPGKSFNTHFVPVGGPCEAADIRIILFVEYVVGMGRKHPVIKETLPHFQVYSPIGIKIIGGRPCRCPCGVLVFRVVEAPVSHVSNCGLCSEAERAFVCKIAFKQALRCICRPSPYPAVVEVGSRDPGRECILLPGKFLCRLQCVHIRVIEGKRKAVVRPYPASHL